MPATMTASSVPASGGSTPAASRQSALLSPGGGLQQPHSAGEEDDYFDEADADDGDEDDEDDIDLAPGTQGPEQEMANETTVKSGYLLKRGEKRKNWKKRWFVLRSSKLYYYKNEKEYQLLRFIDMGDVHTVASVTLKRMDNSFGIVTSKRQYFVRASSKAEMQSWIDALNGVREQVREKNTLTQDLAAVDLAGSSSPQPGGAPVAATTAAQQPPQQQAQKAAQGQAISISIPGKGLYQSPAQPRPIPGAGPGGSTAFSPLTATSGSDDGGQGSSLLGRANVAGVAAGGAEQFGLSYASSSAGQSAAGSSPGRSTSTSLFPGSVAAASATGAAPRYADLSLGGHSPQSNSGGELSDGRSRSIVRRTTASTTGLTRAPSSTTREASAGSSGGGGNSAMALGGSQQSGGGAAQALSSSEDEDGEDWDEETADQAMPLPGTAAASLGALHASTSLQHQQHLQSQQQAAQAQAQQQQQQQQQQQFQAGAMSSSASSSSALRNTPISASTAEFLKDPNKVIIQGYLMKQSSRRKTWRKRWFTLTSSQLSYTRSHMDTKHSRQIPLTSILDAIEYTSKKATPATAAASPALPPSSPTLTSPPNPVAFALPSASQAAVEEAARREASGGGNTSSGFSLGSGGHALSEGATGAPSEVAAGDASANDADVPATPTAATASGALSSLPQASTSSVSAIASPVAASASVSSPPPAPKVERRSSVVAAAAGVASNVGAGLAAASGAAGVAGGSQKKKENCFKIITPKRTYVVGAPTEEEEIKWLSALQALLSRTRVLQQTGGTPTAASAAAQPGTAPAVRPGAAGSSTSATPTQFGFHPAAAPASASDVVGNPAAAATTAAGKLAAPSPSTPTAAAPPSLPLTAGSASPSNLAATSAGLTASSSSSSSLPSSLPAGAASPNVARANVTTTARSATGGAPHVGGPAAPAQNSRSVPTSNA